MIVIKKKCYYYITKHIVNPIRLVVDLVAMMALPLNFVLMSMNIATTNNLV